MSHTVIKDAALFFYQREITGQFKQTNSCSAKLLKNIMKGKQIELVLSIVGPIFDGTKKFLPKLLPTGNESSTTLY